MAEAIKPTAKTDKNILSVSSINSLVDQLASFKREAFAYLDQALNLDSNNQFNEAIILYRKCANLIEKSLGFVKEQYDGFQKIDEVQKIQVELNAIYKQTVDRLNLLEEKLSKNDELVVVDNDDDEKFLDIGDEVLNDIQYTNEIESSNATEIFRVDNNVQIFYIGSDGSVSTPSYPTSLSIYSFNNQDSKSKACGFIKVGTWVYPLNPDNVSIMKTVFGAYVFPNTFNNDVKCSNVGIMFSENVNNDVKLLFDDILTSFSNVLNQQAKSGIQIEVDRSRIEANNQEKDEIMRRELIREANESSKKDEKEKGKDIVEEEEEEPVSAVERVSRSLIYTAKILSKGVNKSSELANKLIQTGGEKIKTQTTETQQPKKVDPTVQKCVEGVRYGTNVTVNVSSYLAEKLGQFATAAARTVAPHIKTGSTKLLTQTGIVKTNESANAYMENVCTIASSSITGIAIVYESLEDAAKSLAKNLAHQSVHVVKHRYGDDASKLADNTLNSVGNVAMSAYNIKNLKIRKTIAKAAATEAVHSFSKTKDSSTEREITKK